MRDHLHLQKRRQVCPDPATVFLNERNIHPHSWFDMISSSVLHHFSACHTSDRTVIVFLFIWKGYRVGHDGRPWVDRGER
jgi:hypothetical protein